MKRGAKEFFEQKFSRANSMVPIVDGVPFRQIRMEDNALLIAKFDPLEVKEVVWECGSDKTPSPDGMNFKFLKSL